MASLNQLANTEVAKQLTAPLVLALFADWIKKKFANLTST